MSRGRHNPLPIPASLHPAVRKSLELVEADPRPGREIAQVAGVNRNVFYNWKTRGGATVASIEAVLNVLGYKLVAVPVARHDSAPNGQPDTDVTHETHSPKQVLSVFD